MFMRLKIIEREQNLNVENDLCTILFNQPVLPESENDLDEDWYVIMLSI